MGGEDNLETFDAAIQLAAGFKIAVVEVMDGVTFGFHQKTEAYNLERVRKNVLIGNADKDTPTAVMGNVGHTQVLSFALCFPLFSTPLPLHLTPPIEIRQQRNSRRSRRPHLHWPPLHVQP